MKTAKGAIRKFYGAFLSTVCLAMCPVMLIYGIIACDAGTRRTGFGDAAPAVRCEYDGGLRISALGREIFIDEEYILSAKNVASAARSFVSPQARVLAGIPSAAEYAVGFVCKFAARLVGAA